MKIEPTDILFSLIVGSIIGIAVASLYYQPMLQMLKTELKATRQFFSELLEKVDKITGRNNRK